MFSARSVLAALVFCVVLHTAGFAQVTSGDIVGRVTDSSGGVLPGATVTIENLGTHDIRTAPSNGTGDYVFNLLPIGAYTVKIEMQGFITQTARVNLSAGDRARFDAKLQLGQMAENVTVTAESPLVQTDSATISALVTEKAVQDLPVSGRNVVRLVQLVPGAFEGQQNSLASGNRPDDRRQTSAVSINGSMDNQNNHLIDGIDNNERAIGTVGVKPSIDAIAEVKVQTSMYTAEVGRTAGGVVNIITKSGSNDFHGSAFEFVRNDRFDARNFFATGVDKPKLTQNQYGGSLGGPVVKDRTFFFADYEGFDVTQGVTAVATVPTAKMRAGDFSELSATIYDPTKAPRTAFAGNLIPASRLDPIAMKILALYPLPTGSGLANNYTGVRDRTQNNDATDFRIDQNLNSSNRIFARYSYNKVTTFTPPVFPSVNGVEPGGGGSFPGTNDTSAHNLGVSYSRVISPTLITEFRGGYLNVGIASYGINYGNNVAQQVGIPGVNTSDPLTSGLTPITLTGYAGAGDATFLPLIQVDHTWQGSGSVTKISGAHSIKGGAGLINRTFTVSQSNQPLGAMTFNTTLTDNGSGSGGNSIASFLLGYPQQVSRIVSLFYPHYNTKEPFFFVQDDWRATSNLTLNLGLRYDIYTPYTEQDNHLVNVNLATSTILVAGQNGVSNTANISTDYSNLAPRVGFSASLPKQVVLRGGYGISYFPGNYMSQSFLKSAPFTSTYGPVISTGASGGLPNLLLSNGLPAPVATDITVPTGTFQAEELDFKNTRTQQYNLFVEKEFAGNVIGGGYLGWRQDHLTQYIGNMDLAPAAPGAIQQRRAFFSTLPGVSSIPLIASDYKGTYDAMQVVFSRRQRKGLTLSANYTLAHATVTNASPWDVNLVETYDSDFDVRHRVVFSANYELPSPKDNAVMRGVFGNWQINTVAYWQTGTAYTIANGTARSNTGGTDRPNQIGDPNLDNPTVEQWFNVAAFQAQAINTAGNTGRNTLHGPPQRRIDLSFFKNVPLTNSTRLQLRAEIFNLTNIPSFATPNANFGTAGFGSITSTGNAIARQMQFAAKLLF